VKTTPKRTTPSKSTTSNTQEEEKDASKEKAKLTRKRRHAEEKLNDANQIRTEDLKIRKSRHLL